MENDRSSNPDPVLGSRVQKVLDLLSRYDGKVPLHNWLREEFRKHRNWGSRDRKFYRQATFSVFRFFPGFKQEELNNELVLNALKLAGENISAPEFTASDSAALRQKIESHFSPEINSIEYWKSFENTPPTWLSSFAHAQKLNSTLTREGISFEQKGNAFSLPANTNLEKIPAHLYRVMDLGTQLSLEGLALPIAIGTGKIKVWDCCAGAGGKSLLLHEKYPDVELYASDSRQSVLDNLTERFHAARLSDPFTSLYDLSGTKPPVFDQKEITTEYFDCILADVPCTGSGTWRRNPENLHFFEMSQIENFADRQKKIITHTLPYLKPGGLFIYITCSVFSKENEAHQQFFEDQNLELISSNYLGGHDQNADYVYRAILKKSN